MGVTSWPVLDARVAFRLAKSSWVVIRGRLRRWAGMGMGAMSGAAIWEEVMVIEGRSVCVVEGLSVSCRSEGQASRAKLGGLVNMNPQESGEQRGEGLLYLYEARAR